MEPDKRMFLFIVNTGIPSISFTTPGRQSSHETSGDFPNLVDEYPETCDDVSNREFINIMWELSDNTNIIQSTVIIKGSQQCHASNTAWFISGGVPDSMVLECEVTEEHDTDLRRCNLLCQCACGDDCGFLHFRVQLRPWMEKELSLCHYEEYYHLP